MKAVFSGSQKKPLVTQISTRHLNEIVRERNQYSRDAMEAWQDFINLKGRMDSELVKVTKRNNFLVDELESWKQQFLKFQAFAEQLTKETQDLKSKIEGHKRENRRLTSQIEQQKDEVARHFVRVGGTEKQRDDAMEALVLQQEIAEELERERKRNKKELSALQHTTGTLLRQRDEAQRVVLHLRALIDGQAHHMEHIVKTLTDSPEANDGAEGSSTPLPESRSASRADQDTEGEDTESRLLNNPASRKRLSEITSSDGADRQLRDKTDAIAYIIRNISEQCAAAVEGLHLAQRAETSQSVRGDDVVSSASRQSKRAQFVAAPSEDGHGTTNGSIASELDDFYESSQTSSQQQLQSQPQSQSQSRASMPPTPDLMRSSTAMSLGSISTAATPDRHSMQSQWHVMPEDIPEVPTRLIPNGDSGVVGDFGQDLEEPVTKFSPRGLESRKNMVMEAA